MDLSKQELRRRMIAARQALDPAERARLSGRAQRAVLAAPEWARARTVLLYIPVRGEVDTAALAAAGRQAGKRLLLPRVERAERGLRLHRWDGTPEQLVRGAYGIPEPRPDLPQEDPRAVDLVVVPGVAFDRRGRRLGYGGGYYDRLLPLLAGAAAIGLGYGFQLVERLPAEAHDVPLDALATDLGLTRFPASADPSP
ncbi:5-formyltetrahydrofolate cyclo-ligase [Symbiobacterium thermophilum]|uniref:5-formyltetrahydrofolate cyclo-ligase n=1 Tax=Symbiobacterium thermophilum TaxID=2734 RepID=UPI0035C7161E